jgi:hypothetical protein
VQTRTAWLMPRPANERQAEAAAVTEFNLSDEQRKRLVVQEQD